MVDTSSRTPTPPNDLGTYLRSRRKRLGLSQRQVAAQAGVHHSKLGRLENGEISERPNPEHLQRIADVLGVNVSKLLAFFGVTPSTELPSVRMYFRRKLGVNADEAAVLANLVADYQRTKQPRNQKEDSTHDTTHQP